METYLFDIETAPSLGFYFDLWREGNIVSTEKNWYMLSFSIKKLGASKIQTFALPDFKGYKKDKEDDRLLVQKLWEFFDKGDILIGHNLDGFDVKKANARFLYHRFAPPSPYKTIDTLKVARAKFKFDSNRLDALARSLGFGSKLPHNGFETWKGCMLGDPKSWAIMKRYNEQDVVLLEKVYLALRPWMTNHPNVNLESRIDGCPKCGSTRVVKEGHRYTMTGVVQKYSCLDCLGWCTGKPEKLERPLTIK